MKLTNHIYFYPEKGMLDCNTYIVKDKKTMIIDIGLDKNMPALIEDMAKDGIDPDDINMICNTHLHMDHAWANEDGKKRFNATIDIAPVQKEFYHVGVHETSLFFNIEPVDFTEDNILPARVTLGAVEVDIIHTPGHSPESICFYCGNDKALICGDLIFDRNIGRSDLPGGDWEHQKRSIETVSHLDMELLLPGHMGIIKGKDKIKENCDYIIRTIF